jgi:hypothetical protein
MLKISSALVLPVVLAGCVSMPLAVYPNSNLPPTFGTVSHSPATVQTFSVVGGGGVTASVVDASCRGYVAEAPTLSVNNSTMAGIIPLNIRVTASADTTLLVRAPDGTWMCDDDGAGNLNPAIRISGPVNGQYDIWVGTFSPGGGVSATLRLS